MAGSGIEPTLILNAGSSSVKFRLYERGHGGHDDILLDGVIDAIGGETVIEARHRGEVITCDEKVATYNHAGKVILKLCDSVRPTRIIHRVTHGEYHDAPVIVTPHILKELEILIPLSPLHLPPSIGLIKAFMQSTEAKHIACFDTMFHRKMPEVARTYAIPIDVARKHGIYRYGFHGLAHEAMLLEAERLAGRKFSRAITCQLGNGASLCAIKDGRSIDTSMGLTPLEGLVMGTRSGDIDPAAVIYLAHHASMTPEAVLDMLEKESGLKGIAGEPDVRKLLQRERAGDKVAAFALDLFAYRMRKYLGAYLAVLGGVDCIVLSGGMPRAPRMRERILRDLQEFGIEIDPAALEKEMPVQLSKGKVQVWAVEVDEQEHMLRLCRNI
jgi:acetate kinase